MCILTIHTQILFNLNLLFLTGTTGISITTLEIAFVLVSSIGITTMLFYFRSRDRKYNQSRQLSNLPEQKMDDQQPVSELKAEDGSSESKVKITA